MRRGPLGIAAIAVTGLAGAIVLAATGVGDEPGVVSNWQALALGIVQGLTELLPISSSGHLILVPWLGDWRYLAEHAAFNQTFDVALHLGTFVAVAVYFRHDVALLAAAWLRSIRRRAISGPEERVAWFVALATVPAALVGALGGDLIAERLGEPWQIAILLAVFGIVLWLADRTPERREIRELGFVPAVAVGVAQAVALMPGVSRSGITITAGRFLGLTREAAARFSFLLLLPIVLGAVLLKGWTDVVAGDVPAGWAGPFLVGTIAAAVSGLAAIWALLGYLRRHDYSVFVWYRLAVAVAVLGLIASGFRGASF
ncbi:MAG: undecaprenyl-diphosphatase UppP [Gaiellaceae bacterium]